VRLTVGLVAASILIDPQRRTEATEASEDADIPSLVMNPRAANDVTTLDFVVDRCKPRLRTSKLKKPLGKAPSY
jgi:hypothetical protein